MLSSSCWLLSLFAAIGLSIVQRNLAGVWLETGILMLLLVSPEDSVFFFFGCAEPLFAARALSLAVARRSDFLVTCVQASHCCGYCCCRAQALERRLSTCVARV